MVFDCLENSATRLVGMGAVGEAALLGEFEDFLEVAGEFFAFHVEGTKALDARGIDECRFCLESFRRRWWCACLSGGHR